MTNASDPLFSTQAQHCGEVVLWRDAWEHIVLYHEEMQPYLAQIQATLERPNLIEETESKKPTLAYYARNLITDDPHYRACYVAVFVRYRANPACVCTAYLPSRINPNPDKLIYGSR
jgi:hypothetical protein